MRTLFLFVALLFFVTSCDNVVTCFPPETLVYSETQCNDAWYDDSTGTAVTEQTVIDYFANTHNITLKSVTILTVNDDIQCQACTCPSGREIGVIVEPADVSTLEAAGFTRK